MARGGLLRAVAHAARLKHVAERQLVRDSLRVDPQRSRGDRIHLASSEARIAAAIFEHRGRPAVGDRFQRAGLSPMLELGERGNVGDALAERSLGARSTADLPQARLRLRPHGRPRGRGNRDSAGKAREGEKGESLPSHRGDVFTTGTLPIGNEKLHSGSLPANSLGSIAKLDEQNAQSTRMNPSSPTIASRSSSGKRAMTERT